MIYIIRHGETELNRRFVLQGRSDAPLNDLGVAQAREAGQALRERGIRFDAVYSSPLRRAIRTAELVSGLTPVIDDRLIEMDYGPYEGQDLRKLPPELLHFFSDFVRHPAPDGMEPLASVTARLGALLEELRRDPPSGNVLLSTHAIAMKGALEYLTPDAGGAWWSKHIGNCAVYITDFVHGEYTVPMELKFS